MVKGIGEKILVEYELAISILDLVSEALNLQIYILSVYQRHLHHI